MSLNTVNPGTVVVSAKEKINNNRKHHEGVFKALGIPDAFYTCKLNWKPRDHNENVISCFISELRKTEDIYIEFTDRDFRPEDPKRTLYKLRPNPHYQEEYKPYGQDRYLVPVSYLIEVTTEPVELNTAGVSLDKSFSLTDPDDDCSIDEMSVRDVAALILRKPVSRKQWLNDLINK